MQTSVATVPCHFFRITVSTVAVTPAVLEALCARMVTTVVRRLVRSTSQTLNCVFFFQPLSVHSTSSLPVVRALMVCVRSARRVLAGFVADLAQVLSQ